MNVLCIIPARGGSKGIPRKNIVQLGEKPLIAWSIEAALAATSINRVIVSTDDEEIASISETWGAETIMRPLELANDTASSESALLHVIETLQQKEQYKSDLIVFLQATSPFRLPIDIDQSVKLLQTGYDSVFSAYCQHFTGRWKLDKNECAHPLNFDPSNRPRRQDLDDEFIENGSIYVCKPDILISTGSRMGGRIGIYVMPVERSWQIDKPEDMRFLEKLMLPVPSIQQNPASIHPRVPPEHVLRRIKLLAMDFDGVLTDNRVWVDGQGTETVCCSRSDSWGLSQLKAAGIHTAVISTESNPVVQARCRKLGLTCIDATQDKASALSGLAKSLNIHRTEVAFVGNDTNDTDALRWAGIPIIVRDAEPTLVPVAIWVLRARGGIDAVRECCDAIINAKNQPTPQYEGEGIYFKRLSKTKNPDYEEEYWGTIRDPDGRIRNRIQEQEQYLDDIKSELNFLNSLSGGKLLDVGCGLGWLLSGLDPKWERHGVEVSDFAARHAEQFGRIFHGALKDATFSSEYFDAIVLYHVIEHLDDPLKALREIRRVLRPGGWLVLGTPDFDSGCARRFKSKYRLLHDKTHVSLFTSESMHRLLRDEGFIITEVEYPYFNTRHFTKENLLRLFETEGMSPPFYGNFMTFYCKKPGNDEPLRTPQLHLKHI
jgi:N-acylneuraminate cytidylyltransferase